jgi:hypothetical protein
MFRSSGRCLDQGIMPSTTTLISHSTQPARRCIPIISTVRLHWIIQLDVFASVPLPVRPASSLVNAVTQVFLHLLWHCLFDSTWISAATATQSVFVSPFLGGYSYALVSCIFAVQRWAPGSPRIRWISTKWSESAWSRSIRRKRRQYRMKYSQ